MQDIQPKMAPRQKHHGRRTKLNKDALFTAGRKQNKRRGPNKKELEKAYGTKGDSSMTAPDTPKRLLH